ncbi:MAG: hypothetical protein IPO14_01070 [Saprospiraceae bacterium]|nr:hypothetical protein [Saprospiraceae bacterium]
MDTKKILAFNVNHLTDARFFAAVGAAFIFFDGNEPPSKWIEYFSMMEWIEGSNFGFSFDYLPDEMTLSELSENGIKFILLPSESLIKPLDGLTVFSRGSSPFSSNILIQNMNEVITQNEMYWQIISEKISTQDFDQLKSLPNVGLAFEGTPESLVGVKDFDTLDQIIENWQF